MTTDNGEGLDVVHAAKRLSDLSASKPPAAAPPPPWQPVWLRRVRSPEARLVVFSLMTIDGVFNLAFGSSAVRPLGAVFAIGGPIAGWQAWRDRRRAFGR